MIDSRMELYCELMQEVKYRVESIDLVLGQQLSLRARIAEELCYLQLRIICESIAIGCLIINQEVVGANKKMMKAYEADFIMNQLETLHPKFFPVALQKDEPERDGIKNLMALESGFLTRSDLIQLYNKECGKQLHRGNARNLFKSEAPSDFSVILDRRNKVVNLLNKHMLLSRDERFILVFQMNGSGKPIGTVFERTKIPGPSQST